MWDPIWADCCLLLSPHLITPLPLTQKCPAPQSFFLVCARTTYSCLRVRHLLFPQFETLLPQGVSTIVSLCISKSWVECYLLRSILHPLSVKEPPSQLTLSFHLILCSSNHLPQSEIILFVYFMYSIVICLPPWNRISGRQWLRWFFIQ